MSAVLRAYGADFDVDTFLVDCSLPVCAVKRRGEPVMPTSQPNGQRHNRSGVHVSVSNAGFDEFSRQLQESIVFLRDNAQQVRRLSEFPGVHDIGLDFGIQRRDAAVRSDAIPAELIRLAGGLGLSIELSQYPVEPTADANIDGR